MARVNLLDLAPHIITLQREIYEDEWPRICDALGIQGTTMICVDGNSDEVKSEAKTSKSDNSSSPKIIRDVKFKLCYGFRLLRLLMQTIYITILDYNQIDGSNGFGCQEHSNFKGFSEGRGYKNTQIPSGRDKFVSGVIGDDMDFFEWKASKEISDELKEEKRVLIEII